MSRTYLRAAGLTAVGLLAAGLPQEGAARALFDSAAVREERFAVLAQPIGRAQWKLLVLEQIKTQPRCWTPRQDGLVEPSLNRFDFSGICKRYLDSNGYSLRSGGQDLGTRFRFRLKQSGRSLRLEALDPSNGHHCWWVRPASWNGIPTGSCPCSWSLAGHWNGASTKAAS